MLCHSSYIATTIVGYLCRIVKSITLELARKCDMDMTSISDRALQNLKEYLDSATIPKLRFSDESDAEYERNISALRKVVNEEMIISDAVLNAIRSHTTKNGIPVHYRICSLGCGNGVLDKKILELLTVQFPNVTFEYVGLDKNDDSVKKAKERFASDVRAKVHNCNVETGDLSLFGKFDSVLALHFMIYMNSTTASFPKFVELLKPQGELFIMHTGVEDPLSKLNEVFIPYQDPTKKCSILSKDEIVATLSKMEEISCTRPNDFEATFDLIKFLSDEDLQQRVLDFIVHVPLRQFPGDVSKLCLEYLKCAHEENAGKLVKMYGMTVCMEDIHLI